MQRHNHRFPMNTRIGNRSSISHLSAVPPIDNEELATGDVNDTFTFTAESEATVVFITHRNDDRLATSANSPIVTGATVHEVKNSSTTGFAYSPYGVALLLETVAGQEVSIKTGSDDLASEYLPQWTTVQAFSLATNGTMAGINIGADLYTLATYGTATAHRVEVLEEGATSIVSFFNVAYNRGGFIPYTSAPSAVSHSGTIVNGSGIDNPSKYEDEQTGGWYSTDVWRQNDVSPATVAVGVRYNQRTGVEHSPKMICLYVDMGENVAFLNPVNVTKV